VGVAGPQAVRAAAQGGASQFGGVNGGRAKKPVEAGLLGALDCGQVRSLAHCSSDACQLKTLLVLAPCMHR
jgi:hypothetical protein